MKIYLGLATMNMKWHWNVGTEAKVLKVLKEKGRIAAIKYYRNDLNKGSVELMASKDYVDALEIKYGLGSIN